MKHRTIWLSTVFRWKCSFWLANGRHHASRQPTCCKKLNLNPVLEEKRRDCKQVVEKFPTSSTRNFSYNPEVLHSQEREVLLLNQWLSIFKSKKSQSTVHHLTYSCKILQLLRNLHQYCSAQTHKNIRIERHTSDIFCSNRRTGISCDNRQKCQSKWKINFSVTFISKKIYETRTEEMHTAWINLRRAIPLGG